MTRERKYANCFLRIVVAVDGLSNFNFLREFARRQHDAFGLKDEKQILGLIGNRVLDIGSGMGYWGLLLRNSGRKTVAIEISKPYLRLTKMLGAYYAVIRASADTLPIKSNCFDTAVALEIIEHVNKQDGLSLIREMKRVSSCIMISTPSDPSSNLDLPKWVPESERHLSYWTEKDFQAEGLKTSIIGDSILAVQVENKKKHGLF
jgi:2-polyprenyl-3-methyl-5-hydroxy-6-metoxy-1,4-benzoquinol methylase